MRTVIDLPLQQIERLDQQRKKLKISRAEIIRRAIDTYIPPLSKKQTFRDHPAFGSESPRINAVESIRKLRAEWD
jgi:metal-responsive CopG/Arc/MetJ family transcriptional regulator